MGWGGATVRAETGVIGWLWGPVGGGGDGLARRLAVVRLALAKGQCGNRVCCKSCRRRHSLPACLPLRHASHTPTISTTTTTTRGAPLPHALLGCRRGLGALAQPLPSTNTPHAPHHPARPAGVHRAATAHRRTRRGSRGRPKACRGAPRPGAAPSRLSAAQAQGRQEGAAACARQAGPGARPPRPTEEGAAASWTMRLLPSTSAG